MGMVGFGGHPDPAETFFNKFQEKSEKVYYNLRYDVVKTSHKQVKKMFREVSGEGSVVMKRLSTPLRTVKDFLAKDSAKQGPPLRITYNKMAPTSQPVQDPLELTDTYTSPKANEDRTITCPNSHTHGCKDLWIPDLYGEFAGVCENCGHHFPLEYKWYLHNIFDTDSTFYFATDITSGNPLNYTGFDARLKDAKKRTGRNSGNLAFVANVMDIKIVVSMLYQDFRSGTVGSAEGEKFVQACELATRKKRPLLSYVHTTGGIRIQEGTLGVTQMPKCTMAVREYIDAGGLYIVVYDNNSYAGPVASFLGCSPYQFAIRSSRVGFAGPRVIRETTGTDIPPDYHSARNALKRGHIQGIWDRRDFRRNLHKCLMTMGSHNLYYR